MRLLLIGGQLQGVEVAYLAKEAGWNVTLVDKRAAPLASLLCDEFVHADVVDLDCGFLSRFDLVFPATENIDTLTTCQLLCERAGAPFAFDMGAYRISSSKAESNSFLESCGVATPPPLDPDVDWPDGYIVKPDSESGSAGVERYATRNEALDALECRPGCIGQAFIDGPVLSIEVVCDRSSVRPYVVTEVVVGDDYDCHRIVAPARISDEDVAIIRDISQRIGHMLDMRGIFDVELVMRDGTPHVLEIDARFPSQTPIAIYHATGINLFTETASVFCECSPSGFTETQVGRCALLQHVRFADQMSGKRFPELVGECQLKDARPFERMPGIPDACVALAAKGKGGYARYYTLVSAGDTHSHAMGNMEAAISAIEGRKL